MMLYCYHCGNCDKRFEELREMEERATCPCPSCGSMAQKVVSVSTEDAIFQPRWYHNLAPVPVYVESRDQFTRIANAFGNYSDRPFTKRTVVSEERIKNPSRREKRELIRKLRRGQI